MPTLDFTSLLALDTLPESLIFPGGGHIGAELAQMMARLGVQVTVLCRHRLLSRTELDVSAARDTRGVIRLLADADSGGLLGGVIVASKSGDSVQTLALALKAGMTTRALGEFFLT